MNYLLRIALSCWLTITTTAVIAAGNVDNHGAISDEPSSTIQTFPSVHLTVRAPTEESHQPVLIEGFWPLMQRQEQLLLLQGSWQRQQQHHLLSLGLGWRYFPETDWGVGYHLFYDQETRRQQHRLGLGAEVWLRSLTLTVNGYLPANGWRAARDLKGYQHCPASGYDVTLQGHFPALPHLGASLDYARYYGDEVALEGVQQRYRNPQQWRWGINITPMPLLTLAYRRHATPSARAKQQISVTLTYQFSLTLLQQVDPNQVEALYSAQRQRLTPVQREQWIALKYAAMSPGKALSSKKAATRTEQLAGAEEPARVEEPVIREEIRLEIDEAQGNNPEIILKPETNTQEKTKHVCKYKSHARCRWHNGCKLINNVMPIWQKSIQEQLVQETLADQ